MKTKIKKFLWFDITPRAQLYAEIEALEEDLMLAKMNYASLEEENQQIRYNNMELTEHVERFQDCCNNKNEIIDILKNKYSYVKNYLERQDSDVEE